MLDARLRLELRRDHCERRWLQHHVRRLQLIAQIRQRLAPPGILSGPKPTH